MIEKFGLNQTPITNEQWIKIGNQMKTSPLVKFKVQRFIAQAQHQSKRFQNIGYLSGIVLFIAFLKFPVIRVQPGFQRIGISAGLAYPFYSYMNGLAEKLKVKRFKYAYRKTIAQKNAHQRIYM